MAERLVEASVVVATPAHNPLAERVHLCQFSADGRMAATTGTGAYRSTVAIWNTTSLNTKTAVNIAQREGLALGVEPHLLLCGHQGRVTSMFLSPSVHDTDVCLAVTSGQDQTMRLWDLQTGRCEKCVFTNIDGTTGCVSTIAGCERNGEWLVCGGVGGAVDVYDFATMKLTQVLPGHSAWVNSVATWPQLQSSSSSFNILAPDPSEMDQPSSVIATAGKDDLVKFWDLRSNQVTGVFEYACRQLALVPRAQHELLCLGADGTEIMTFDVRKFSVLATHRIPHGYYAESMELDSVARHVFVDVRRTAESVVAAVQHEVARGDSPPPTISTPPSRNRRQRSLLGGVLAGSARTLHQNVQIYSYDSLKQRSDQQAAPMAQVRPPGGSGSEGAGSISALSIHPSSHWALFAVSGKEGSSLYVWNARGAYHSAMKAEDGPRQFQLSHRGAMGAIAEGSDDGADGADGEGGSNDFVEVMVGPSTLQNMSSECEASCLVSIDGPGGDNGNGAVVVLEGDTDGRCRCIDPETGAVYYAVNAHDGNKLTCLLASRMALPVGWRGHAHPGIETTTEGAAELAADVMMPGHSDAALGGAEAGAESAGANGAEGPAVAVAHNPSKTPRSRKSSPAIVTKKPSPNAPRRPGSQASPVLSSQSTSKTRRPSSLKVGESPKLGSSPEPVGLSRQRSGGSQSSITYARAGRGELSPRTSTATELSIRGVANMQRDHRNSMERLDQLVSKFSEYSRRSSPKTSKARPVRRLSNQSSQGGSSRDPSPTPMRKSYSMADVQKPESPSTDMMLVEPGTPKEREKDRVSDKGVSNAATTRDGGSRIRRSLSGSAGTSGARMYRHIDGSVTETSQVFSSLSTTTPVIIPRSGSQLSSTNISATNDQPQNAKEDYHSSTQIQGNGHALTEAKEVPLSGVRGAVMRAGDGGAADESMEDEGYFTVAYTISASNKAVDPSASAVSISPSMSLFSSSLDVFNNSRASGKSSTSAASAPKVENPSSLFALKPRQSLEQFSSHGFFVTGSDNGDISIWRLVDGHLMCNLTGHCGPITYLAIEQSLDSSYVGDDEKSDHPPTWLVASSSLDGSVRVWRIVPGLADEGSAEVECLVSLTTHGEVVTWLSLFDSQEGVVAQCSDGCMYLWNIIDGEMHSRYEAQDALVVKDRLYDLQNPYCINPYCEYKVCTSVHTSVVGAHVTNHDPRARTSVSSIASTTISHLDGTRMASASTATQMTSDSEERFEGTAELSIGRANNVDIRELIETLVSSPVEYNSGKWYRDEPGVIDDYFSNQKRPRPSTAESEAGGAATRSRDSKRALEGLYRIVMMFPWGVDTMLDSMLREEFGIPFGAVMPKRIFGIPGVDGSCSFLIRPFFAHKAAPQASSSGGRGLTRWNSCGNMFCLSSACTAYHLLTLHAVCSALVSEAPEFSRRLRSALDDIPRIREHDYIPPCAATLIRHYHDRNRHLRTAARLLFQRLVDACRGHTGARYRVRSHRQLLRMFQARSEPGGKLSARAAATGLGLMLDELSCMDQESMAALAGYLYNLMSDSDPYVQVDAIQIFCRNNALFRRYFAFEPSEVIDRMLHNLFAPNVHAVVATASELALNSLSILMPGPLVGRLGYHVSDAVGVSAHFQMSSISVIGSLLSKRPMIFQRYVSRLVSNIMALLRRSQRNEDMNSYGSLIGLLNALKFHFPTVDFHKASFALVVGNSQGLLDLYNLRTFEKKKTVQAYDRPVNIVTFSPGGRYIAAYSRGSKGVAVFDRRVVGLFNVDLVSGWNLRHIHSETVAEAQPYTYWDHQGRSKASLQWSERDMIVLNIIDCYKAEIDASALVKKHGGDHVEVNIGLGKPPIAINSMLQNVYSNTNTVHPDKARDADAKGMHTVVAWEK